MQGLKPRSLVKLRKNIRLQSDSRRNVFVLSTRFLSPRDDPLMAWESDGGQESAGATLAPLLLIATWVIYYLQIVDTLSGYGRAASQR